MRTWVGHGTEREFLETRVTLNAHGLHLLELWMHAMVKNEINGRGTTREFP